MLEGRIMTQRRKIYVAIAIAAALWSLIGGYAFAASFIRTADNSVSAGAGGGDGSYNRGVACGDDKCYAHGGGTNNTSTGPSNLLVEYDIATDTWTNISTSPTRPLYRQVSTGFYNGYFVGLSSGTGSSPSTTTLYSYNVGTDTWQTSTTKPVGWGSGTFVGVVVEDDYYLFETLGVGGRIDITNLAGGWTLRQGPINAPVGCQSLQFASIVYDPAENELIIFIEDCAGKYDLTANTWTFSTVAALPEISTPVSLAYYDANNGITFGYWDQLNSRMEMYLLDTSTFSYTATTNLTDANLDYGPFDDATVGPYPIPSGGFINDLGETEFLFGSARTNLTSPTSGTANRWWLVTGDPGGVVTVDKNIDTWLQNFLDSMNLGSPFGRILAGVMFAAIVFIWLSVLHIPWIISLGAAGMATTFLTAALIFPIAIFLALVAAVMFGGFAAIIALLARGE
jgi:hypothetical protein